MATTATAAAVAACAAAVAACAAHTRNPLPSSTEHAVPSGSGDQTGRCAGTAGPAPSAAGGKPAVDDGNESDCAVCDEDDAEDVESEHQKDDETPSRVKSKHKKLWCNELFPRGSDGANNYEMENLLAVQSYWKCTCRDRDSCLSPDRVNIIELYRYRMAFQTEAKHDETYRGFRDSFRRKIEEHYSSETKSFSRSFVIGSRNDCCIVAAGLASGLSFQTFAASRADCTRN
eukprot:6189817-Pleurochrysis_carterae.AAC.1